MKINRIKLFLLPMLTMALTACGGGGSGGGDSPPPLPAIVSLQVTPATTTIPVGFEQQYQAEAKRDDGSVLDVTRNPAVIWSSSDPSIATIDSQGLATGVTPGEVHITASGTANGKPFQREVTLTVSSAIATALQVTPAETTVPAGFEQQFTATAQLSDGSALEVTDNAVLNWSSSDPAIASISNAEGSKGRVTSVSPGTVTITASGTANGAPFSATAQLEVTDAIATALQVTPAETTVPAGFEQQFTATAQLSDGSALEVTDNAVLNWSSSNPAIATISNEAGHKGLAIGVTPGTVTITASGIANGTPFTATALFEVTQATASSLRVMPASSTVPAGLEQQFTAIAQLSDGSALEVTDNAVLSWSSSDPAIATISNAVGNKGLATGVAPGTVTITASGVANGKPFSATAQFEVTDATATSLQVTPVTATVPAGFEQQFTATAVLSDGRTLEVTDNTVLSWSSSDPTIATVSNEVGSKGLVTGITPGTVTITASGMTNGKPFSATGQLTVTAAIATSLQVTPATARVPVGLQQAFTAIAQMSDGSALEVTDNAVLSWSSSDPTIATISNSAGNKGVVTGVRLGTVTITASGVANDVPFTAAAQLTVTDAIATSLLVTPTNQALAMYSKNSPANPTLQFSANLLMSDGSQVDVTTNIQTAWVSHNLDIATINNQGLVKSVSEGVVTIRADYHGLSSSTQLTVGPVTAGGLLFTTPMYPGEADSRGIAYSAAVPDYAPSHDETDWNIPTYVAMTFDLANDYCNGMPGYRLPTLSELQVLRERYMFPFTHWGTGYLYISSTQDTSEPNNHMSISLNNGQIISAKPSNYSYVTCVKPWSAM
ncbi:Ig-like domain-containing protein [Aeromonas dhakensis]